MIEKIINSRIIQKHDIESRWLQSTFVPEKGELVVYDIEEGVCLHERLKIGDGQHNINQLPFITDIDFPQSDWDQNDPSAEDYIKNRIAYDGEKTIKIYEDTTIEVPFTAEDLIGLKVTDINTERWMLKTPKFYSAEAEENLIFIGNMSSARVTIAYMNPDNILTRGVFGINGTVSSVFAYLCPELSKEYNIDHYDTLIYVFEPTSDNLGLGLNFDKGWYFVQYETFDSVFIGEEPPRLFIGKNMIDEGTMIDENSFYQCFTNDPISFTISEENLQDKNLSNNVNVSVMFLDKTKILDAMLDIIALAFETFIFQESKINVRYLSDFSAQEVHISYPYLKQIDPKFIQMATEGSVGGIKAEPVQENDLQPVRISENGQLYTNMLAGYVDEVLEVTSNSSIEYPNDLELIGLKVEADFSDVYKLVTPEKHPPISEVDEDGYILNGNLQVQYIDNEDFSDHPLLGIGSSEGNLIFFYPEVFKHKFYNLIYAYEDTEVFAMGQKIQKGWYGITQEAELIPLDYENMIPLMVQTNMLGNVLDNSYIYEIFKPMGKEEFIIKEENIIKTDNYQIIFSFDISGWKEEESILQMIHLYPFSACSIDSYGHIETWLNRTKLYCQVIKQIDPKFIPPTLITEERIDALITSII